MATGQLQFVLTRGRAYRCVPCGYEENKSRTKVQFYSQHVMDAEIPFVCVTCDFKTGDKKKLDRHLESPGHMEKLESGLEGLEVIHSSTPKYIQVGKDIVKLSKEDSVRHWTKVSMTVEGKDDEVIEDLRPQLLGEENMELTPKRVVLEDIKKSLVHRETQTDEMSLDRLEGKIDALKGDIVSCLDNMFQYMEQMRELNSMQEGVIKKLEERLEKERQEKEGQQEKRERDDRDRRRREEHRDRRRERSRSRERR